LSLFQRRETAVLRDEAETKRAEREHGGAEDFYTPAKRASVEGGKGWGPDKWSKKGARKRATCFKKASSIVNRGGRQEARTTVKQK